MQQTYPHIDAMLTGVPFDMMVTLTDMQVHGDLNKKALMAGKHVWSEKPMANTYAEGKALLDLAKSKKLANMGSTCCCEQPAVCIYEQSHTGRKAWESCQCTWTIWTYRSNMELHSFMKKAAAVCLILVFIIWQH